MTTKVSFFSGFYYIPLENVIPNNGTILIYVVLVILVILLAAEIMRVDNILDSEEDFKKRQATPINLVYFNLTSTRRGATPQPLITDLNDPTGVRMMSIFPNRTLIQRGTYIGVAGKKTSEDVTTGTLNTTCSPILLATAETSGQPVHSKGLPVTVIPGKCATECSIVVHKGD